jgi:hypothetical protein
LIHVRNINRNGAGGCGEVCPGNADRRRAASDEDTRGLKAIAARAPAVTAPTGEDTDMSFVFKVAFLVNVKSMLLVAPALLTTPIVEVKDVSVGPGALSLPVGLAHVMAKRPEPCSNIKSAIIIYRSALKKVAVDIGQNHLPIWFRARLK